MRRERQKCVEGTVTYYYSYLATSANFAGARTRYGASLWLPGRLSSSATARDLPGRKLVCSLGAATLTRRDP
jgi:hypothetical protein